MENATHPGIELFNLIKESDYSQREVASIINVAHSLLNSILKGNRSINVSMAISLEAANFKTAEYWLNRQLAYTLSQARSSEETIKKNRQIETWEKLNAFLPLGFLKRQEQLDISTSEDAYKILDLFEVKDPTQLKQKIELYEPEHFRKSSRFSENRFNVYTWKTLAELKAKNESVGEFDVKNQEILLDSLNQCFYNYSEGNTIERVKNLLSENGIKFVTQDRPSKTPVDGKSFISDGKPAIALSLKYKRLDNFAFTLFHELGHVFLHLAPILNDPNSSSVEFYLGSKNSVKEFEADQFAQNNLIPEDKWFDFINFSDSFKDSVIYNFANENSIHPAIVRGRICHEFPEYYRRRTTISKINRINLED